MFFIINGVEKESDENVRFMEVYDLGIGSWVDYNLRNMNQELLQHKEALRLIEKLVKKDQIQAELVGKMLGRGQEGVVVEYDSDKALKLTYRPHERAFGWKQLEKMLGYLVEKDFVNVVQIYDYGLIESGKWWVVMERLEELKTYEVRGFEKLRMCYYEEKKVRLSDLSGLSKLKKKKKSFYEGLMGLKEEGLYHDDLWSFNVMKDSERWKVIDIESFEFV